MVTGVGGNVGQGILRNIRWRFPDLRIVATDVHAITAGHHFSDAFHQVPYAVADGYFDRIQRICADEDVALILPSTDYEVHVLGRQLAGLPPVLCSPASTTAACLDKWKTWQALKDTDAGFVETVLPRDYRGEWKEALVKPREGRGSRGVVINPVDPASFDDSFIVQRLLRGREITAAFYVTKTGRMLGPITFMRLLQHGMTERCEVVFDYDEQLRAKMRALAAAMDVRGPVNLQAIVEDDGNVVLFEVNCRYSGTNSIRARLGFEDVKYGIEEYLYGIAPEPGPITGGSAIRIMMDLVYPGVGLAEIRPGGHRSFLT
jgi:carbamoyl-phosphate synthase large subunit